LGRLLPTLRGGLPCTQIDGAVERKISRLHDSILPYGRYSVIQARHLSRAASRKPVKSGFQGVLTLWKPDFMS
jgi:hypothetical protein